MLDVVFFIGLCVNRELSPSAKSGSWSCAQILSIMGLIEKDPLGGDKRLKNGYKNGIVTQHQQHKSNGHKLSNGYNDPHKSDYEEHVSICHIFPKTWISSHVRGKIDKSFSRCDNLQKYHHSTTWCPISVVKTFHTWAICDKKLFHILKI